LFNEPLASCAPVPGGLGSTRGGPRRYLFRAIRLDRRTAVVPCNRLRRRFLATPHRRGRDVCNRLRSCVRLRRYASPSINVPLKVSRTRPTIATQVEWLRIGLYRGVAGTQRVFSFMRFLYRGLPSLLVFLWLSAHVSSPDKTKLEKPLWLTDP